MPSSSLNTTDAGNGEEDDVGEEFGEDAEVEIGENILGYEGCEEAEDWISVNGNALAGGLAVVKFIFAPVVDIAATVVVDVVIVFIVDVSTAELAVDEEEESSRRDLIAAAAVGLCRRHSHIA